MTSLQERLFAMQDKQYAAFQAKLTPGVPEDSIIGVRVPVLRKFAKEFAKRMRSMILCISCLTNTMTRICCTACLSHRSMTMKNASV